jgi:hypothetical protein
MKTKLILSTIILTTSLTAGVSACDLCACDLPLIRLDNRSGWHAGVSEQYTSYESMRLDGHSIGNPAGQYLHSSITQIFVGYDLTRSFGVQLNVPLIYRSFRRTGASGIETGDVSGFGDISLLAHWSPVRIEHDDFFFTARLSGGIKLPTGDSERVLEEASESEGEGPASGVHGHDLALGTGSVDGIFGADMHMQWKRLFLDAGVQVAARGQGRHDYDFADDLSWHTEVGVVAWKGDALKLAVAARLSGETKGEDTFRGVRAEDTSSTTVYLGPRVVATWRDQFSVDAGFDFPIRRENSGVQSVPDLRFQAAVNWQF